MEGRKRGRRERMDEIAECEVRSKVEGRKERKNNRREDESEKLGE